MRRILCFVLLFMLAGCSGWKVAYAPVPLNTPDQDTAEVVVIRNMTYFAAQVGRMKGIWVVAVDDHNYASLRPGQYTMFPVSVNNAHEIGVKRYDLWWHDTKIPVAFEPGQRYYFLARVDTDQNTVGIKQISPEVGKAWMAKAKYVQVTNPK